MDEGETHGRADEVLSPATKQSRGGRVTEPDDVVLVSSVWLRHRGLRILGVLVGAAGCVRVIAGRRPDVEARVVDRDQPVPFVMGGAARLEDADGPLVPAGGL